MALQFFIVSAVSLGAAILTFFSGFGLGTLLLPAFALFFPIQVAVAATAVVHLSNNLFKAGLVARHADWQVVLRFGVPGAVAALSGAQLLALVAAWPPVYAYDIAGGHHVVAPVKLVVALLMIVFATLELIPALERMPIPAAWISVGGLLSGFFGGISGFQGALRSAFLARAGLGKEAFIGTSIVAAVMVDVSRLAVYGLSFLNRDLAAVAGSQAGIGLLAGAVGAALAGTVIGNGYLKKITMEGIQRTIGVMLVGLGVLIALGII